MTKRDLKRAIADFHDAKLALEKIAKKKASVVIEELFVPLLQKHRDVVARVSWEQYTPHFNDGDPCYFGVYGLNVVPCSAPEDASDDEYPVGYCEDISEDIAEDFEDVWDEINDDDLLQAAFGDGVRVVITTNGLDIEDCDHE